jgi:hypothetical protein
MKPDRSARRAALAGVAMVAFASMVQSCRVVPRSRPIPADSAVEDTTGKIVELVVTNHNWSDVVVYLNHGSLRTRLGMVQTARSTVLRFPMSYAYARAVSLIAAPIGSPSSFESERFVLQPGQHAYWTIENSLSRSSLMIR